MRRPTSQRLAAAQSHLCSGCGGKYPRANGDTGTLCLRCETATRLEAVALAARKPALVTIAQHNAEARRRAGVA